MAELSNDQTVAPAGPAATVQQPTYAPSQPATAGLGDGIPLANGYLGSTLGGPTSPLYSQGSLFTPAGTHPGVTPPADAQPAGAQPTAAPAAVGGNVMRQAEALVEANAGATVEARTAAYREALAAHASSPLYQAALVRAMDAEAKAALAGNPNGLDWERITQDVENITAALAAATGFDSTAVMFKEVVWLEVYIATLIQSQGAAELAGHMRAVADGPASGPVAAGVNAAQRDGLISREEAREVLSGSRAVGQASVMQLADPVEELRRRYEEAKARFDALENDLWTTLEGMAPALHGEEAVADGGTNEIHAYVEQFRQRPDYIEAREAAEAAANALGEELDSRVDDLLARGALTGDPGTSSRTTLLDTYEVVAGGPRAFDAVVWADQHLTDPMFTPEEQARIRQISELAQATDATSKMSAVGRLLEGVRTEPTEEGKRNLLQRALAYVNENICKPYGQIRSITGLTELKARIDQINRNEQILLALFIHGQGEATQVAARLLGQAPAGSSTIVSRVWGYLVTAVETAKNANGIANPESLLGVTSAARGLHGKLEQLYEAAQGAAAGEATAEERARALVLEASDRTSQVLAAGFTLMAIRAEVMTIQTQMEQLDQLRAMGESNVALQIECVARIASVIGNTLSIFPPPVQQVGVVISSIAGAITTVARLFTGDVTEQLRLAHAEDVMTGVTGDAAFSDTINQPASYENLAVAEAAGITKAQIRGLVADRPWLFTENEGYLGRIEALRAWLVSRPDLGRFTGTPPTLYSWVSTLSQSELDALDYYGIFAQNGTFDEPNGYYYFVEAMREIPNYERMY